MRVDVLEADDPRWCDALSVIPHDFYSLPAYGLLAARFEGGAPIAILVEEGERRLLLPLLIRDIPLADESSNLGPRCDAVSPYGYPGIGRSATDPDQPADELFLDAAMAAIRTTLNERGVVSLFLRLNPLLPVEPEILARHGQVVDHGHTVSVDLLRDDSEFIRSLRRGHAKALHRLDRLGFTCEFDEDGRPETIATLVEIYQQAMDRNTADASYYFDSAYVTGLIRALSGHVAIVMTRLGSAGEVATASLLTEVDGIVQDHIGGTRSRYLSLSPAKLETRESVRWARARGNRRLHLGGGRGGSEDTLFRFKSGFSPERHLFQTVRFVIDRPAYDELVTGWEARSGEPAGDLTGFFPAYRAPIPIPGM